MKKIILLIMLLVLMAGCADKVSFEVAQTMDSMDMCGFWSGLWHGLIAMCSFIGSLFSDDIAVYAIYNNGCWYDWGFLIGVGAFSTACCNKN